jgi:hypothetical protein
MIDNILKYNFGKTAYATPAFPDDIYFGLSTTVISASVNYVASVTAMAYTGKVVTLTATNAFEVGDLITVEGVNAGFTVTNIDGNWTCETGTNATTIKFTVASQPVGATPQTISVGTVSGTITEPAAASGYNRITYSNNAEAADWTYLGASLNSTSNTTAVAFDTSTASWGTAVSLFIASSITRHARTVLWFCTLNPSIIIPNNTLVTFAIGSIVVTMT